MSLIASHRNFERAAGRPRPEPGLLTPGSRPLLRTSLECSLSAPGALNSRVFLRIPFGSVDVGTACCARHRHALRTRDIWISLECALHGTSSPNPLVWVAMLKVLFQHIWNMGSTQLAVASIMLCVEIHLVIEVERIEEISTEHHH